MKITKRVIILLTLISIMVAISIPSAGESLVENIDIIRDQWGVLHVVAGTDEDAFYGLGYATAQDRMFQMHLSRRIIQGRLAETIGNIQTVNGSGTALENDIKNRTIGYYRHAAKVVEGLDQKTMELLFSYAAGVNAFLADNEEQMSYLFKHFDTTPEKWTPADSIAAWIHLGTFFSGDGLTKARREEPQLQVGVIDNSAAVISEEDIDGEWLAEVIEFFETFDYQQNPNIMGVSPSFSHAWAVGGSKTTTGSAVLVSDPQISVQVPALFYNYHIKGDTIDARGIGVPGSPNIIIGFNQNTAWGATALGADQADIFKLTVNQERGNTYLLDGEWVSFSVKKETIRVRGGDDHTITIKESFFGPVVTDLIGVVDPEIEYALCIVPLWDPGQDALIANLEMMRAETVYDLLDALENWHFPSVNFILADKDGNIGYQAAAGIPLRSPNSIDFGASLQDGTETRFAWQGILPVRLLPRVVNPKKGYIYSGNHLPITTSYPLVMGTGHTIRSWRLMELLSEKEIFTPEEIRDIHYDNVNPAIREILRLGYHLRDNLEIPLSEETTLTLRYLSNWYQEGSKSDVNLEGTALTSQISFVFRANNFPELVAEYGGGGGGLSLFLRTLGARLDRDENAKLNRVEVCFVETVLSEAWNRAIRRYGSNPRDWHEAFLGELEEIQLAYFQTLDGFPSLDPSRNIFRPNLICIDGNTIWSQVSQAYTQWVPLHDVDKAESLLPIGNNEELENPYIDENLLLWAEGGLHPAPFSLKKIYDNVKEFFSLSVVEDI